MEALIDRLMQEVTGALTPQHGLQLLALSDNQENQQGKQSKTEEDVRPSRGNNYCCPFIRNHDGSFSARSAHDPAGPYRPLPNSAVLCAHVFAKPLPDAKRKQFEAMKALEPFLRPVWAKRHGDLGTLLPPYHLAIALRMALVQGDEGVTHFWMLLDKTELGVRYKTMLEETIGCVPAGLQPNGSTLVAKLDPGMYRGPRGVTLYDVVAIAADDPKPASLETHLSEASEIEQVITGFASTHCWELVQRIVALFDPYFDYTQVFDFASGRLLFEN